MSLKEAVEKLMVLSIFLFFGVEAKCDRNV